MFDINSDKIFVPLVKFENKILDHEMLYSDKPISKNKNFVFNEQNKWKDMEPEGPLNSYGYRCDNFKDKHDGLHVVFAGCSETWGMSHNKKDIWSYKVYEMIKNEVDCSGYFNIGIPGSSIPTQIISLFKYFKNFGKPNYIFINFPDFFRYYNYSINKKSLIDSIYDYNSQPLLHLMAYQYYFMLEEYCNSNNIKLFSFTWMPNGDFLFDDGLYITKDGYDDYPLKTFKTFYEIDQKDMILNISKYIEKNKDKKYLEVARDGDHYGIAFHQYWADFIYKKYKNDK